MGDDNNQHSNNDSSKEYNNSSDFNYAVKHYLFSLPRLYGLMFCLLFVVVFVTGLFVFVGHSSFAPFLAGIYLIGFLYLITWFLIEKEEKQQNDQ